jgi:uncharacterized protein (TIGR02594 family)
MAFFVKHGIMTDLFSEPSLTSVSKRELNSNAVLGDPLKASDGFLFFATGAPTDEALKGWVPKDDCEDRPDAARLPVVESFFVQECVNTQLRFNSTEEIRLAPPAGTPAEAIRPWEVSADFLIARAIFETGIQNLGANIPGSDGVGPLQVTIAEWKDFTDNGGVLSKDARGSDRNHPVLQIDAAAWRQHAQGKAMSKIRLDAGKATAADPFVPSFLDMFFAHVTNSPAAALAILDAQTANKPPTTSIKEIVKDSMSAADLTALFTAREKIPGPTGTVFFGTDAAPSTLKAVVDVAESTLKKLLEDAAAKISQHRPDMVPAVTTAGSAPWLAVAEQAKQQGIKEGANDDVIRTFFDDTDFGHVTGTPPAWCGAFAAHCMKQSGNVTVAASVPTHAAAAASWKNWGADISQSGTIPPGAVIVLSPGTGTGGSGHVAFFLRFSDDKKNVILLGGNQSNKVGETPFLTNRIAAVRWLDIPGAAAAAVAVGGLNLPNKVKAGDRPNADIIMAAFAAAGYGRDQQIAAVANAIEESALDEKAHTTVGEDSVGLFQLRRFKGVGGNNSVEALMDPNFNTQLIIAEAKKVPPFGKATNLGDAVEAFVRFVERPKDIPGQSAKRFNTAKGLIA